MESLSARTAVRFSEDRRKLNRIDEVLGAKKKQTDGQLSPDGFALTMKVNLIRLR